MKKIAQKFTVLLFCLFTITISLFAQPPSCDMPNEWDGYPTSSMTFMITSSAYNSLPPIQSSDAYVVVLNNNNLVVGSACIADDCLIDEQKSVPIWADDQFTEGIDGALNGDELFWFLVDGSNLYTLEGSLSFGQQDFVTNGLSAFWSFDYNLECSIEEDTTDEEVIIEINDPCTSLSDYNSILLDLNPIQKRDFNVGWNMFGFPCQQPRSVSETFAEVVDEIYIIKNNEGLFYWPDFDFDGLGDLIPLEGYQTKLYNPISDFRFCTSSINLPEFNIIGCSNCEACNFNPYASSDEELNSSLCIYPNECYDCFDVFICGCTDPDAFNYNNQATEDDSSCYPIIYGCLDPTAFNFNDYDFDGLSNVITGINGLDVNTSNGVCIQVVNGCTDPNAYNFSQFANTNDGSCGYYGCMDPDSENYNPDATSQPSDICLYSGCMDESALNYNADANTDDGSCQYQLQIGDNYQGGIIFYIDGSGEHGLVASEEDINEGTYSNGFRTGFPWGCSGQDYTGAEGTALFTGYQNSQFIVDFSETQNCSSPSGSVSAAEKCLNYNHNGYDDWYLPSKETLILMSTNIGPGPNGSYGNIGNFVVGESYWSSSEGDVNLNTAWSVIFYDYNSSISGTPSDTGKNNLFSVRAVRSF